jgi:HD-like signal output (HDOD) protein
MPSSPHDLLRGYVEVSTLPLVYTKLNEAMNDPRRSLNDIALIISEDAGLSARLLRIVNSALYNFPTRVESVARAVTIIGTQQVRVLALATSVLSLFKGIPEDLVNMESFWRHGIATGLAARTLATFRRAPDPEFFFTAGILHDIGRLLMFMKAPEESRESIVRAREQGRLLNITEREVIGFDHGAAGRALAQVWKLPARMEEIIAYHNSPGNSTQYPVESSMVHVADIIAHAMEMGSSGELFVPPLFRKSWDILEFSPALIGPTMEHVERQYEEIVDMLLPEPVS